MELKRVTVIPQEDYETETTWTCAHCKRTNQMNNGTCLCGGVILLENTKRWWISMKEQGIASPDITLEQFDQKHGVLSLAERYDTGA